MILKMTLYALIKMSIVFILVVVCVGCSDRFLETGLSWEMFSATSDVSSSEPRLRRLSRDPVPYPILILRPDHRPLLAPEDSQTRLEQLRNDNQHAHEQADTLIVLP